VTGLRSTQTKPVDRIVPIFFTTTGALPTGASPKHSLLLITPTISGSTFFRSRPRSPMRSPGRRSTHQAPAAALTQRSIAATIDYSDGGERFFALNLPAGDWDCPARRLTTASAAPAPTALMGSVNTTLNGSGVKVLARATQRHPFAANSTNFMVPEPTRFRAGNDAPVYLNALATFASGAVQARGRLECRRMLEPDHDGEGVSRYHLCRDLQDIALSPTRRR